MTATKWLWEDEKERAWVVGYADDPRMAERILEDCRRGAPENIRYYARIQIVGIERKRRP